MWAFETIREQIKERLKYKADEWGSIYAVKCVTQADFDLAKSYYSEAFTSCYNPTPRNIEGEFKGEDWYFIEKCDIDYGMEGHETKYWFETLTQKKEKFESFLAEYEEDNIGGMAKAVLQIRTAPEEVKAKARQILDEYKFSYDISDIIDNAEHTSSGLLEET